MSRSIEQLVSRIDEATRPGFRGRLHARGLARNLIWSKGQLPEGSQEFAATLTLDLLSYGLALFQLGLELRSQSPSHPTAIEAFSRAGEAIESVIRDGDPEFNERGFYTVVAAAAYHLGHYSARAFSLFPSEIEALNLSPAERTLTLLMRRDLAGVRRVLLELSAPGGFDQSLAEKLNQVSEELGLDEVVYETLNTFYHQAIAEFDYALEAASPDHVQAALGLLDDGIEAANEYCSVPFWWIFTITRHLLDDLWDQSLHVRLPESPDDSPESKWATLRRLFIAKLQRHDRAELDLWPSQLAAAARAVDMTDDLVAALPTSAGKTRIAEICILRALAFGKRIVFVTPLRALSAQTERALRQTFAPLGFSVSSLYGSSGATGDDVDSLRNRNIVVTTPEKLDFALRNNPDLLDTVGLIVLDEAHTIGAGEREIRYEVLVQRLLRRPDAASRRIVCLSAILPQGDQIQDFVAWIRQDQPGNAVTVNWRPTRQCYGEIAWSRTRAILRFRVAESQSDAPFVDSFVKVQLPRGRQKTPLPRNRQDLSVLSAWRLIEEGHTVLLYCPERRSVIPLAERVLDLVQRGYLQPVLEADVSLLSDALNIGREWLGDDHPAVRCLRIGVAVHHGQLPRPFLRAVERLLKDQLLKVTIASPTLAQGLNLSATTVLFTSLKRGMSTITGEEFANVAGRAGRAFVDVEGQVLCVAWEREHLAQWDRLLEAARERNLKSGLLQLIMDCCNQIALRKGYSLAKVLEYVTGNARVWDAPKFAHIVTADELKEQEVFERKWRADLSYLDSALLSLVQHDIPLASLATAIDEALRSSLWERSLSRENEETRKLSKALLERRADFIWRNSTPVQRRGYFFAGVSFSTGHYLDKHSEKLNKLLLAADVACAEEKIGEAVLALIEFAKIVFKIDPFAPDDIPDDWEELLTAWISGKGMSDLAGGNDTHVLEFIEGALVYRLVWALEAVRVRQSAMNEEDDEQPNAGRVALALETGTPDFCAALLIQSGLSSRIAATKAVSDCPATFDTVNGLRRWLRSDAVKSRQTEANWPTPETGSIWRAFVANLTPSAGDQWSIQKFPKASVEWTSTAPATSTSVRVIYDAPSKRMQVFSIELDPLGALMGTWPDRPLGIVLAEVSASSALLSIVYLGPKDLFSSQPE